MTYRRCYICGIVKPITEFRINNREKLGRGYECLQCDNAKSRNYVTVNADKRNRKRRQKYANDDKWREREKQRNREYYREKRNLT